MMAAKQFLSMALAGVVCAIVATGAGSAQAPAQSTGDNAAQSAGQNSPQGSAQTPAQAMPPLSSEWAPGAIPGETGGDPVNAFPIVTGEPFRAEFNTRRIQTMPDGTQRVYEYHGIVARDSQGRVYRGNEGSPVVPLPGQDRGRTFIPAGGSVTDPVAQVRLNWNDQAKMVMKMNLRPEQIGAMPLDACEREEQLVARGRMAQNSVEQDLGERTMQGIAVRGCRLTSMRPAGESSGGNGVTVMVDETWSSPELRVTLLRTRIEPDGGTSQEQLDHIVRGEPDASLFEAPAGYTVHDMDAERAAAEARAKAAEIPIAPGGPGAWALGGPWEFADPALGSGAEVGIFLHVRDGREVTVNQGAVASDVSATFTSPLEFEFYQRVNGKEQRMWFSAGLNITNASATMSASWDGQRLQALFKSNRASDDFAHPDFALDLKFDQAQQVWTGAYTRDGVTKQVQLARPGASVTENQSPLVGTWLLPQSQLGGSVMMASCMSIDRAADGTFMAWLKNSSARPYDGAPYSGTEWLVDDSGDRWAITVDGETVTLDQAGYGGFIGGAPPRKFVGALSADGTEIAGKYIQSGETPPAQTENDAPSAIVTKTTDQACMAQTTATRPGGE